MTITAKGHDTLRDTFLLEAPSPQKELALIGTSGQVIARTPIGPQDWEELSEGDLECRKPFENLDPEAWNIAALALMAGPPFYVQPLRSTVRVEVNQTAIFSLRAP